MMSDVKSSVQKQFGQVAANYTTSAVHARGVDLPEMVTAAQLSGGERVLDVGCGAGHTALTFAPHVAQVVALDLTEGMLAQACKLAQARGVTNVEFRQGDAEQLPFAVGEFDRVVSRLSAHHWPHPQRALEEVQRVLKPGGLFVLSDVVSFDDFTTDTFVQALELIRDPSHVRDHTVAQWLTMFAAAHFQAEVVFQWDIGLEFGDWVERMAAPPVHVEVLKVLMAGAPGEVRRSLKLGEHGSFAWPGALIRGLR
jgi:ubiquinone/menaquinone biosynthesis C-methylase UbiE